MCLGSGRVLSPLHFRKVPTRPVEDGQLSSKLADIIFRKFGRPGGPQEPPVQIRALDGTEWLRGLRAGVAATKVQGAAHDTLGLDKIIETLEAGDNVDIW